MFPNVARAGQHRTRGMAKVHSPRSTVDRGSSQGSSRDCICTDNQCSVERANEYLLLHAEQKDAGWDTWSHSRYTNHISTQVSTSIANGVCEGSVRDGSREMVDLEVRADVERLLGHTPLPRPAPASAPRLRTCNSSRNMGG